MADVAWRARAQELLREILAIGDGVPAQDAGGWIGRELSRARPAPITRYANGPEIITLDPYEELSPAGDVWLAEPSGWRTVTVGLDDDGAILSAVTSYGRGDEAEQLPTAVGWRLADGTPVLVTGDTPFSLRIAARGELGDGAFVVLAVSWAADDAGSRFDELRVAVVVPDGPGAVRHTYAWADGAGASDPARARATAQRVVLDAGGRPAERWGAAPPPDEELGDDWVDLPGTTDVAALVDAAVDLIAAAGPPERPVLRWSSRLHGTPPPLPTGAGVVDDAARAMLGTLRRAAAATGVPAPCAVALSWSDEGHWAAPLPGLLVVDRAFPDAYRKLPGGPSAVTALHRARAAGEAAEVSLVEHADEVTLAAWLPLRRAVGRDRGDASGVAADRLVAVRRRLLQLLLAEPWPAPWVAPVLPWLAFGPCRAEDGPLGERGLDPWREIEELAATERFAALTAVWPPGPARSSDAGGDGDGWATEGGEEWAAEGRDPGVPDDELTARARVSRPALRALLEREGLGDAAERLSAAARYGFDLVAAPAARSRIGGPPVLPEGAAWPTTVAGEPLAFVAAIDLRELPDAPEALPVPRTGWLLVYVLVGGVDAYEGVPGFVDLVAEEETAVVLHVPDAALTVVADPPALGVLRPQPCDPWEDEPEDETGEADEAPPAADAAPDDEGAEPAEPVPAHPVGFRLRLEPATDYDVGERMGLHPSAADRYDGLVWGPLGDGLDDGDRWEDEEDGAKRDRAVRGRLLGCSPGVQGHPVDDDEIVLLALAGTAELGLEWGDGGDLRVVIRPADAREGRWDRAWATGDSN